MSRGCRICQGKPKRGTRCMFCGLSIKAKKDMDQKELFKEECFENEVIYLKQQRSYLIKYRMKSTGCPELDQKIVKYAGDWRDQI